MEEFKKIVAQSFIEAYKKNPLVTSKTALAKKISEEITGREGKIPDDKHYKSLLNYYDYFFEGGKKREPTETIINKLLYFLNYDSLDQFIKNQPIDEGYLDEVPFVKDESVTEEESMDSIEEDIDLDPVPDIEEEEGNGNGWLKKIIITISITIPMIVLIYFGMNWSENDCMIWSENHYKKIACDDTPGSENKLADQKLLDKFKKAKIDTVKIFFEDGKPLYWYAKTDGEIELFTAKGEHPISDKKLRPITETIVRNYILKE